MDILPDITEDSAQSQSSFISIFEMLPPDAVLWTDQPESCISSSFHSYFSTCDSIFFNSCDSASAPSFDRIIEFNTLPQPAFNKNFQLLDQDINSLMEQDFKVFISSGNTKQFERLRNIFSNIHSEDYTVPSYSSRFEELDFSISGGFIDKDTRLCIYTDHQIFQKYHRIRLLREVAPSQRMTINELNSLTIGDYIVHIDHGVGVFGGLVKTNVNGQIQEAIKIVYKDNDVVLVSIHGIHRISRYKSKDGTPPKIFKLGSGAWEKLKNNAKSKVKDIAKDLIKLYAQRKAAKGFSFSPDSFLQTALEAGFMYEDTPDQVKANSAIKSDMEKEYPMDRLVCGDVGFGKTELAIRASFKAVCDGKQVAVLVPTTILALQHFTTFTQRLKDLPCRVDYVSRLRTAGEITQIKKDLFAGKIDILIGTHKILGSGFDFKDLGLLVIDEEQKFGVSAKEKLRQLKSNVDTLTLTATPIPRTLQFSLLGARDLSIINTPPPNRIPVQTEIILFDEKEIKSIINYELNRGGQLFFLHNKVEELKSIETILHRLVPDMKICVAHGQMESKELEDKMLGFMRGDYDMLLCTTIIENGLDIPNANTIIVNQAQNIGLSDLHQLRGRVGRSNKRAFCYLIVPPLVSITDDARRRLKAIEEFSDLGSGFNIAMQDLDIRGAGNMLGAQQSGFIMDMGYETYQKILSEALEELGMETGMTKGPKKESLSVDCNIETDQTAQIPDDYIDVTAEKIRIYKNLDSITNEKEIDRFVARLVDRFGKLPQEVDNLIKVVKIRNIGAALGFEKIIFKNGMLIMFFSPVSSYLRSETFSEVLNKVNEGRIFEFKQTDNNRLKLITRNVKSLDKALACVRTLV